MTAYFRDGAAGPAIRAARVHQAPALARIAGVIVEDPAAVRACFQSPPPAVRCGCQHDGEHATGKPAGVLECDAAIPDRRAHAEPGGPFADAAECVYRQPGQWSFAWVLDGRVIQDVLTYPLTGQAGRGIGTSIRSYDPASGRWQVIWLGAVSGITVILHGGKQDEEILLEGPDPDGTLNQWRFTGITHSSFTWTGHESADHGTTWHLRQRMTATRSHP